MPKRKSSFHSRRVKEGKVENETSSESEEIFDMSHKRIRPDRSSIENQEEEIDSGENGELSSLPNDADSEDDEPENAELQSCQGEPPISSEPEDDPDSNDIVESKNGCYDGFASFLKSYQFFSEDEDSQERPSDFVSKYVEGDEDKVHGPNQDDSFMNTTDFDCSNIYVEDLKDRIRIVSFHVQRTEIVFMDHPISLPLFGHLKVTLLSGKASIHGHELIKKKPFVVFSQKQTGLLSIDSLPFVGNNSDNRRELRKLLKKFLIHVDPKTLKEKFKGQLRQYTVAVVLQELPLPPSLQFLQLYSKEAISFKNTRPESESLYTSVMQNEENVLTFCDEHEELFHVVERHLRVINKKKKNEVVENTEIGYTSWSSESDSENSLDADFERHMKKKSNKKVAEPITQNSDASKPPGSRILIYGPKKSGKSTMLRYLINKFLNSHSEVFFLDTDPGQTEFTPPGVVSLSRITEPLFGPPYTHMRKPLKSIFTGTITAETSPPMHIRSVIKLITYFNEKYPNSLLLVNTMGWIVGIGEMMLQVIKKHLKPTVEIELSNSLSSLDYTMKGKMLKCVVGFERDSFSSTNKGDFRPPDLRDWALLSYLGQCQNYFQQPTYINAMRPVCVCWDDIYVYNFNKRLPYNRYYEALNCSVVALCHVDDSYLLLSKIAEYPNTLDDEPDNECIGFGFVRALDEENHLIYIVTPLDLNSLKRVNAILSGNIVTPRSVLLNQPIYDKELDYTDECTLGQTKERKAIRRRSRMYTGQNDSFKKRESVQ